MPDDYRIQDLRARIAGTPDIGFHELRQACEISALREALERVGHDVAGLREGVEQGVEQVRARFAALSTEELSDAAAMASLLQFAVTTLLDIREQARSITVQTEPVADDDRPFWLAAADAPRMRAAAGPTSALRPAPAQAEEPPAPRPPRPVPAAAPAPSAPSAMALPPEPPRQTPVREMPARELSGRETAPRFPEPAAPARPSQPAPVQPPAASWLTPPASDRSTGDRSTGDRPMPAPAAPSPLSPAGPPVGGPHAGSPAAAPTVAPARSGRSALAGPAVSSGIDWLSPASR
ncbi:hypothetical protein [Azospirillum thermophilum]|nr:hypothetical protein [Azospirillum thermophilum]